LQPKQVVFHPSADGSVIAILSPGRKWTGLLEEKGALVLVAAVFILLLLKLRGLAIALHIELSAQSAKEQVHYVYSSSRIQRR